MMYIMSNQNALCTPCFVYYYYYHYCYLILSPILLGGGEVSKRLCGVYMLARLSHNTNQTE